MLKKIVMFSVIAALLAVPAVWSVGQSVEAAPSQQSAGTEKTITVTGYGVAYGSPDIVRLGLGVEVSEQDVKLAMDQVNSRMNAVLAALKERGVATEDIRTEYYSIWQDYSYSASGMSMTDGGERPAPFYRVSTTAQIIVRDSSAVGELIAASVDAGANVINYIEFSIEDRSMLESEARGLAVADARSRAEELAGTLGLTLGEPVNVVEGTNGGVPMMGGGGGYGGGVAEASVPAISGGQLSVSMNVTITYALQ